MKVASIFPHCLQLLLFSFTLPENSDPFKDFVLEEFVELDFQKIPTDGHFR